MTNWLYMPEFSGAGLQSHRLAKALQKLGVQVHVLTGTTRADLTGADKVEDIPVYRVLQKGSKPRGIKYAKEISGFLLNHKKQFDLVHTHGFQPRVTLAAARMKLPIVQKITALTLDDPMSVRKRRLGALKSRLYAKAEVVVPTSAMLENVARNSFLPNYKIIRIPNGVETDVFYPLAGNQRALTREQLGLPNDKVIITTVGSITYRKGLDLMIEALRTMEESIRETMRLLVIGPEYGIENGTGLRRNQTMYFMHLQKKITEYKLDNVVSFMGEQSNVNDYLAVSDIYLHAARSEGQPNAILEAMSSGLPIVANNLPGITDEIVQAGKFGYLADAHKPEHLAAALRVLIKNQGLRQHLGEQARQEILDHYDINMVAERYVSLYNSIIHRNEFSRIQARDYHGRHCGPVRSAPRARAAHAGDALRSALCREGA